MIHKAKARCQNGHSFEFGPCNKETRKFFFFKSICTSTNHEVLSPDEIQCLQCKTIHMARVCPECSEHVPVSKFKQKSLSEILRKMQ